MGTRNGDVVNVPLTVLNDAVVEGSETVVLMASFAFRSDSGTFIGSGSSSGSGSSIDSDDFIGSPGVKASFAPGQDRVSILIWDNDGKY